jgi:hypothetical protein
VNDVPQEWSQAVVARERVPIWQAELVAAAWLTHEAHGVHAVRALILDPEQPDTTRGAAAKVLAARNDAATSNTVATILRSSPNAWARLIAAEALAGPWAERWADALIDRLSDEAVVCDFDIAFRVSDTAAKSLWMMSGAGSSSAEFAHWRMRRLRELNDTDRDVRALAAYALAATGELQAAEPILVELVRVRNDEQARRILEARPRQA